MEQTIIISDDSCSSSTSAAQKMVNVQCAKEGQNSTPKEVNVEIMDLTQEDNESINPPLRLLPDHDVVPIQDTAASTPTGSAGVATSGCNTKKRKTVGCSPEDNNTKKAHTALDRNVVNPTPAQEMADERPATLKIKMYKPGEFMKYMNVRVHPELLSEWYTSNLQSELAASKATLIADRTICREELLHWTRNVPVITRGMRQYCRDREREPRELSQPCERALCVVSAERLAGRVAARALGDYIEELTNITQCKLTLLVFGLKEHFQSIKKAKNKNPDAVTDILIEMAIADMLVRTNCDAVMVDTPNELALQVVQFTKAIAETPYKEAKRALDEIGDSYMRGDNKKCVAIDKNGVGVSRLWQQMLAVLPMSSLETSRAICAKYKSPRALNEALQSADSMNELADIRVSRAAVPGARARRLGPEFARKLKTLFTAEDGNILIE